MTDAYFWIIFVFVHEAPPLLKANVTDLTICLQQMLLIKKHRRESFCTTVFYKCIHVHLPNGSTVLNCRLAQKRQQAHPLCDLVYTCTTAEVYVLTTAMGGLATAAQCETVDCRGGQQQEE